MRMQSNRNVAISAARRARFYNRSAKRCRNTRFANTQLITTVNTAQGVSQIEERTSWLILAHPRIDLAKAVPTAFSSSLCLLLDWLATRLSKTRSDHPMVTVPPRPNRRSHKPQTRVRPTTTHVTLPLKGGCNYASALFRATTRCTPCARIVHANHTPHLEVSPC